MTFTYRCDACAEHHTAPDQLIEVTVHARSSASNTPNMTNPLSRHICLGCVTDLEHKWLGVDSNGRERRNGRNGDGRNITLDSGQGLFGR